MSVNGNHITWIFYNIYFFFPLHLERPLELISWSTFPIRGNEASSLLNSIKVKLSWKKLEENSFYIYTKIRGQNTRLKLWHCKTENIFLILWTVQRVSAGLFPVRSLHLRASLWASRGSKLPAPASPCRQPREAQAGSDGTLYSQIQGSWCMYVWKFAMHIQVFSVLIFLPLKAAPRAEPCTAGSLTALGWDLHPFFCPPLCALGPEGWWIMGKTGEYIPASVWMNTIRSWLSTSLQLSKHISYRLESSESRNLGWPGWITALAREAQWEAVWHFWNCT